MQWQGKRRCIYNIIKMTSAKKSLVKSSCCFLYMNNYHCLSWLKQIFFNGSSITLKHCSSTSQLPIQIWVVCLNPTDRWFVQPPSKLCLIILRTFVDFSPLYCSPTKVYMNQLLHTSFSPNKYNNFTFTFYSPAFAVGFPAPWPSPWARSPSPVGLPGSAPSSLAQPVD